MSPDDTTTGATPGSGATPDRVDDKTPAAGATPAADDAMATDAGREALRREREARLEAERELKALRDKDLPEAERTRRERDELKQVNIGLQAENKRLQTANTVLTLATKMGFADPGDAVAFATDVDGSDTRAVEARLAAILKDKPYLASAAARPVPGGADLGRQGQPPAAGKNMNDLIRQSLGINTGG